MVGYETQDGSYRGTTVNFDGYPSHMGPILSEMMLADIVIMVEKSLAGGGVRGIDGPSLEDVEYYRDPTGIRPITSWPDRSYGYSYRKCLDGTLEYFTTSMEQVRRWEPKKSSDI